MSVDTAPVTFQTPCISLFCGGVGKAELRLVAGGIGSELLTRLKVKLSVSSQFRSEALGGRKRQCEVNIWHEAGSPVVAHSAVHDWYSVDRTLQSMVRQAVMFDHDNYCIPCHSSR